VEPLTHALTSLLLARAFQRYLPPMGAWMLVVAGVAPDLDYLSYFAGPSGFLRFHRTLLHSFSGCIVLAFIVSVIFFVIDRGRARPALGFLPALAVCAFGIAAHVVLDLTGAVGVRLMWPFRDGWIAYSWEPGLDPWILLILALGIFLPGLVGLVSEEIGDRKHGAHGQKAAMFFLLLFLAYLGARAALHHSAIALLNSREYRGSPPLAAGAFPTMLSPFLWRAVVSTDTTIDEKEISLAPGSQFDPDRMAVHYKPQASVALEAALSTESAKRLLHYARFPIVAAAPTSNGYRFVLRDLRFSLDDPSPDNVAAIVELSSTLAVIRQQLLYANSLNR
jgi:membrane-bound metal-dependent hydrolase YbcI (DUF457 family)